MSIKKLKTLHLASFLGNIGDNANHRGAEKLFRQFGIPELEFHQLEIREFFRGKRTFDQGFIDLVNTFDLLIVGGGNYFELWPENSKSGTTIDLAAADLDQIKTPILFYSLGVDPGQGCTAENQRKFREFLDYCTDSPRTFVSVRNDGAKNNLERLFPGIFTEKIRMIPDGGFFANYPLVKTFENEESKKIGINIAGDMLEQRTNRIGKEAFVHELVKYITGFLENNPKFNIIFFPHIFRDVIVLGDIFKELPDHIVRKNVQVSQYGQGDLAAETIFGQYNDCELILGNRFHANVVPLGKAIPTIGLSNYLQIPNLYNEIDASHRVVDCNAPNFSADLIRLTQHTLNHLDEIKLESEQLKHQINTAAAKSAEALKTWFDLNY